MYQDLSLSRSTPISGRPALVAGDDRGMRLGDDVLVLDGDDGDIEADHGAGRAREVAGAGDDVIAGDVALVGPDEPAAVLALDAR